MFICKFSNVLCLNPYFLWNLVNRHNIFCNQFTTFFRNGCPAFHIKSIIFDEIRLYILIYRREYNDFYGTIQVFQRNKCHILIIFCKFGCDITNKTTDNIMLPVSYDCTSAFLIRFEICRSGSCLLLNGIHIFFQWMTADINTKHIFFKCKFLRIVILPNIRILHLIFFFLFFGKEIKQ